MTGENPLFGDFTPADVSALAEYGIVRRYPKNSILINKGDESLGLYIVIEGRVKVFVGDEFGGEIILRYQGVGQFFGELAMLDDSPRSASVATSEDTRVSYVSQSQFEKFLDENSGSARKLISHLIHRVRTLTDDLADCALKNVYQRVKGKLESFITEVNGEMMIDQPLTHAEIAGLVGSGREMVSRVMKKLQKGGYIEVRNKRITILKTLPRNLPG